MVNPKKDIAEVLRRIQLLNCKSESSSIEAEELDFYRSVFSSFDKSLKENYFQTLIPISFNICSFENASKFASHIGLYVVQGKSGRLYLSFSEGIEY